MLLAEKYDVDLSHLGEVASREHWVEERALRSAQIHKKALAAAENQSSGGLGRVRF
jgi:hypothetical protein